MCDVESNAGVLPSFLQAFPLDMSQYVNLFNSTRVPDSGMDRLEVDPDARHIAVISRGEIYTFDAIDENVSCLCTLAPVLSLLIRCE